MENVSYSATFTLTAFGEMDNLKYLYGCCALLGYLIIIFINLILFVVIVREESLHEPMYIFIGNLALNGLYGSTAFFPKLIADLMSEKQTISHVGCLTQIFFIYTFLALEFYTLALMAFDRYVAICNPLRNVSIMTTSTVFKLIIAGWAIPAGIYVLNICLITRLPLCGSIIEKVYCQLPLVLKLSCVDASINYSFHNFVSFILALVPTILILISYLFIIKTSVQATKEARSKAMQTCAPHLLTFTNYIVSIIFEISQHYSDTTKIPNVIQVLIDDGRRSTIFGKVIPRLLFLIFFISKKSWNSKVIKIVERITKKIIRFLPFIECDFLNGHRFFQDNDPKHTASASFMKSQGINWVRTLPESPGMNPIEMVWHSMKQYIRHVAKLTTKTELQ
nr:PREDICTED: olfactory receptor 6N1-like [Latimeria chalumnae]|eukprot:XP_014351688.1 PREDICTED: olfactory receptor 6N1-like [Latimeria chalumnae]